jgi:amino acid permease
MLTLPNAYSKVGLLAAIPLSLGCAAMSFWTMYCLIGKQQGQQRQIDSSNSDSTDSSCYDSNGNSGRS